MPWLRPSGNHSSFPPSRSSPGTTPRKSLVPTEGRDPLPSPSVSLYSSGGATSGISGRTQDLMKQILKPPLFSFHPLSLPRGSLPTVTREPNSSSDHLAVTTDSALLPRSSPAPGVPVGSSPLRLRKQTPRVPAGLAEWGGWARPQRTSGL